MMIPTNDVRNILTPEEMKIIRAGFDVNILLAIGRKVTTASYGPAEGLGTFLDQIYHSSSMESKDRERVLITLLAIKSPSGTPLALHIYWGLMSGLEVEDIAQTLLVIAAYHGADTFNLSMNTLKHVLTILKQAATTGAVTVPAIAQSIATQDQKNFAKT